MAKKVSLALRRSSARGALLASAAGSALVLAAALPAQAQQADPAEPVVVEELVVTGVRQSLQEAQTIKKNSDLVIDSVVAEDVGKLPDNNVAEALARVTGVQIRRDSGEANSVLIRGLPNVVTLLNGREVFTTIGRYIALADIPSTMLQRVDVYKSNSADQLEGGIAGSIDVRTRRPFDAPGFQLNAGARGVYSDKSESFDPDVSATISNTWAAGEGELGALLSLSYQRRHYHEERVFNTAPEPQTAANAPVLNLQGPFVMGQIPIAGDRQRPAGNFVVQWRPNDNAEFYAEGFVTEDKNKFHLDFFVGLPWLGTNPIATVFPGTNQTKTLTNTDVFTITSTQANKIHSLTQQYAAGGSYRFGNLKLSTDLAYTHSKFDYDNPIVDVSIIVPNVFVDTNYADGTPLLRYGGIDLKDGRNYSLSNFFDNYGHDKGNAFDWRADAVYSMPEDGFFKEFSAGVRYARREAESIRSFLGGTGGPPVPTLASSIDGLDALSEPMAGGGPQYDLVQWYTPDADFLLENTDRIRQAFGVAKRALDPGSFFSDEEITYAGYVQTKIGFDLGAVPVDGVFGVRVVRTDQTLTGNVSQGVPGSPILIYTPIVRENESTDWLPSGNLRFSLRPDLVARLTASRTLTRPDFAALNPGVSLSTIVSPTTPREGSGGNPNLKPVTSDNFDAALEWYFAPVGSITATAFYRRFEGYIQPSRGVEEFGGENYTITRPGNTGSGNLKGIEIAYQQFFDFLPGPLAGLGLQANFTYMKGETENVTTGRSQEITGLSKYSYNIVGLYERGPWSGRVAYNWRSSFLDTRNMMTTFGVQYDLYAAATAQMDASVSYKINDDMTLTLEGVNLLDTHFQDYFNDPVIYPRDTRRYDRTIQLGFRWRL
jgi:iron complex outermembrane recepter protein